jgi:ribosomal protein S6
MVYFTTVGFLGESNGGGPAFGRPATLKQPSSCGTVLPLSSNQKSDWCWTSYFKKMNNAIMPAAEASTGADERELASYELAFHVLPTVAEGEVATVFQKLKDMIIKHGGTLTNEEAPARFDLAYEIVKYLEGRNRKFGSAYFGWVRFQVDSAEIEKIADSVEHTKELLRYLLIRLTKTEEQHPFFFHEALAEQRVKTIDTDEEVAPKEEEVEATEAESEVETEETTEDGEESIDKV